MELLSYYAGAGIYGPIFRSSPYTIGWVETHGLALLIGLLFLRVAVPDGRHVWSAFAIAVHTLLGTANLVFWGSFVHFNLVTMGIAATVAHALFVAAHTDNCSSPAEADTQGDRTLMGCAVKLARQSVNEPGRVSPKVGAVVARHGVFLGEASAQSSGKANTLDPLLSPRPCSVRHCRRGLTRRQSR